MSKLVTVLIVAIVILLILVVNLASKNSFHISKCTTINNDTYEDFTQTVIGSCMKSMRINRPNYEYPKPFCACAAVTQASHLRKLNLFCDEEMPNHLKDILLTSEEAQECLTRR